MIPSGIHLIIFGSEIDQCCVFLFHSSADVSVFQWDPQTELLFLQTDEQLTETHVKAVRSLEHDQSLGPYPLNSHEQWCSLTSYITENVLARASIPAGTLICAGSSDDETLVQDTSGKFNHRREEDSVDGTRPSGGASRVSTQALEAKPATFVELDIRRKHRQATQSNPQHRLEVCGYTIYLSTIYLSYPFHSFSHFFRNECSI